MKINVLVYHLFFLVAIARHVNSTQIFKIEMILTNGEKWKVIASIKWIINRTNFHNFTHFYTILHIFTQFYTF